MTDIIYNSEPCNESLTFIVDSEICLIRLCIFIMESDVVVVTPVIGPVTANNFGNVSLTVIAASVVIALTNDLVAISD